MEREINNLGFSGNEKQPYVLPHHLFLMAAIATAKGKEIPEITVDGNYAAKKGLQQKRTRKSSFVKPARKKSSCKEGEFVAQPVRKNSLSKDNQTVKKPIRKRSSCNDNQSVTTRPVRKRSSCKDTNKPVRKKSSSSDNQSVTSKPIRKKSSCNDSQSLSIKPIRKKSSRNDSQSVASKPIRKKSSCTDNTKAVRKNSSFCENARETRRASDVDCSVEYQDKIHLTLLVHFEDGMNRRMTCTVGEDETSIDLADELVYYGLICEMDHTKIAQVIKQNLSSEQPDKQKQTWVE